MKLLLKLFIELDIILLIYVEKVKHLSVWREIELILGMEVKMKKKIQENVENKSKI